MRKESRSGLTFEMPSELLRAIGREMKPERALSDVSVVYTAADHGTGQTMIPSSLDELFASGYRSMARINLGMAEMGLSGDLCCLEDYEDVLRDDADEPDGY